MSDLPHYPVKLTDRFRQAQGDFQRRLTTVEARTACIDSGFPLAMLPGVIDPAYTSGDPMVAINGQPLSGPYQHLTSYTPSAGDSVLMAPVGVNATYIVLGKISN